MATVRWCKLTFVPLFLCFSISYRVVGLICGSATRLAITSSYCSLTARVVLNNSFAFFRFFCRARACDLAYLWAKSTASKPLIWRRMVSQSASLFFSSMSTFSFIAVFSCYSLFILVVKEPCLLRSSIFSMRSLCTCSFIVCINEANCSTLSMLIFGAEGEIIIDLSFLLLRLTSFKDLWLLTVDDLFRSRVDTFASGPLGQSNLSRF